MELKKGVRIIMGYPISSDKDYDPHNGLLELIDKSIENVMHYFSASNWSDVYPRVVEILKITQNAKVEDPNLLAGVEIISTLYLETSKVHNLLETVYSVSTNMKRPTHNHAIEFFLQKALAYWLCTRPKEFVKESENDTPLTQTAASLFDFIYSSTEDSKRPLTSFSLLGFLLSFNPSNFVDDERVSTSTMSKVRSFKRSSNKNNSFLKSINKLVANPNQQLDLKVIASCANIIRTGATVAIFFPNSPLATYSKSLYRMLLCQLFASPSRYSENVLVSLSIYQPSFLCAFSVLNPDAVVKDVYKLLADPSNEYLPYIPNLLQGHLNLRQIPVFSEHFNYVMEKIYPIIRYVVAFYHRELRSLTEKLGASGELNNLKLFDIYVSIVKNCFSIYAANPEYIVRLHDYNIVYQEDSLFLSIKDATISPNKEIQNQAMLFCWSFLDYKNLLTFDSSDVSTNRNNPLFPSFMQFGSFAQILAEKILRFDRVDESAIKYLKLIKGLLDGRLTLIQIYKFDELCNRDPTHIEPAKYREAISSTLETTMYICLLSGHMVVCKLAFEILNCLVQEAVLLEDLNNMPESSWSIVSNFALHSEFSSSSYVLTGTVAVQKRLYNFLRQLEVITPTIISSWKITVRKWRLLSQEILSDTNLDREKIRQWRSYAGLLCSLLSPWLVIDDEKAVEGNLSKTAKVFLNEMLGFLTLEKSPFLRETARDILSRDTNHFSYHFIFKTIENEVVTRTSSSPNQLKEQDFLFLEQCVMLLSSVTGIINSGDLYLSTDIGALGLTIVQCLDLIPPDERTVRLRVQYCHLAELVSGRKDSLNLKHEIRVRNDMTTIFAGWLDKCLSTRFSDDNESMISGSTSCRSIRRREIEYERLQKECIFAIIQAFTVILLDLRLDPHDATHEKDVADSKAHKFGIFFTLFLRLLEKCRLEETGSHTGSLVLGDRLTIVKANTIECASKLLNSNLDVGLKFALPLGLDGNSFLRVSFIKILGNILAHRSEGAVEETEMQRQQELAEFITNNIDITHALCDVCPATEVDEFANALLKIFDYKGKCLNLVKAVVTREVERAGTTMEILRRNCVATKILSIYAHQKGIPYLRLTLMPFLRDIVAAPELYTFETNVEKLRSVPAIEGNQKKLDRTIKKLVEALEATVNEVPMVMREICNTIASVAGPKFPASKDSSVTAVSAFFFLRFICPALVSPEGDGLLDTSPTKDIRRTLLVLAKMLQNMAFGSTSFAKLAFVKLRPSNYTADSDSVMTFLRNISVLNFEVVNDDETSLTSELSRSVDQPTIDVLHKFLYFHWEDINHKMIMDQRLRMVKTSKPYNSSLSTESTEKDDENTRNSHRLTSLIRSLGRPRSLGPNANVSATASIKATGVPDADLSVLKTAPRLKEFMSRNAHRDMGPIIEKRLFSEAVDRDGSPLFVISARNYRRDEVDTELALCRFFQVASKMWTQKFAFFYDATGFTIENAFPSNARSMLSSMIPEEMVKNCVTVYILNVSTDLLPSLKLLIKKSYTGIFLNPLRVQYVFLTSADIVSRFNVNTLNLDPRSVSVLDDVRIIFNTVYRYNNNPTRQEMKDVTIKLGNEYVQIKSQEPFNYIKSSPGRTNDIYDLREIHDVYRSSTNGHPDEFTIEVNKSPENLKIVLHCSRAYEIVRAIINAKNRLPSESKISPQAMSPETSIASLLNIGLSGLCSESSEIQEASYNLMSSIQRRFSLNLGMELHGGKGLRLPANVFGRVKMFSAAIALARPDITLDMLDSMFHALEATSAGRRQGVLMYAIPWVKNMGRIFLPNNKASHDATASVIRKFLDISVTGSQDYMFLLQDLWPCILEDVQLIPIVIDEILFLLMDNGIYTGPQLDDTVSILTSLPSKNVCEGLIFRIRSLALSSSEVLNVSLPHSPRFQENIIMVTVLSAIVFENPTIVETFYAEICLCTLILLYTGPYSFRKTLYNLVVNTMHALLYSPSYDSEQKAHVRAIWKDLTGSKGNMIFGIGEELRSVDFDYPVTSLAFQVESCANILTDLAATFTSNQLRAANRQSVVDKCLEMARTRFSVLQSRAILALGCASRVHVEELTVSEVLTIMHDAIIAPVSPARDELLTCIVFSLSRLADGLHFDSRYLPRLFWFSVGVLSGSNMKIYGYALNLLQTVLKSLDEYGAFRDTTIAEYFLLAREEFRLEAEAVEDVTHIVFSKESFEVNLTTVLMSGLLKSITRSATLAIFEVLLRISARNTSVGRERENSIASHTGISTLESGGNTIVRNNSVTSSGRLNSPSSVPFNFGSFNYPTSTSMAVMNPESQFSDSAIPPAAAAATEDAEIATISSGSMHFAVNGRDFPSYMPYLFILYLGSRSSVELRDYLWLAGYSADQTEEEIPSQIKAFVLSDNKISLLCVYLAAYIFRVGDNEELVDLKVLACIRCLANSNIDKFFKTYFTARPKLLAITENAPTMVVLTSVLETSRCALVNNIDLSHELAFTRDMDAILFKSGMGGVSSVYLREAESQRGGHIVGVNGSKLMSHDHGTSMADFVKGLASLHVRQENNAQHSNSQGKNDLGECVSSSPYLRISVPKAGNDPTSFSLTSTTAEFDKLVMTDHKGPITSSPVVIIPKTGDVGTEKQKTDTLEHENASALSQARPNKPS